MGIFLNRPTPFLNLLRGTKTIQLGDAHVEVPASVVSQAQAYLRQNKGVSGEDIVSSVAKGQWAQSLARAFCMPEERIDVPEEYLSETEKGCIDTVSLRLAREIMI